MTARCPVITFLIVAAGRAQTSSHHNSHFPWVTGKEGHPSKRAVFEKRDRPISTTRGICVHPQQDDWGCSLKRVEGIGGGWGPHVCRWCMCAPGRHVL